MSIIGNDWLARQRAANHSGTTTNHSSTDAPYIKAYNNPDCLKYCVLIQAMLSIITSVRNK